MIRQRREIIEHVEIAVFRWPVAKDGYTWADLRTVGRGRHNTARVLVPADAFGPAKRLYDPFREESALFQEFAGLQVTETAIQEFATRYGMLGGGAGISVADAKSRLIQGETLEGWHLEIIIMRDLVRLWTLTRQGDSGSLKTYIHWRGENAVRYGSCGSDPEPARLPSWPELPISAWIASRQLRPDLLERFTPFDTLQPARWYLQSAVNQKLAEHAIAPRLLWNTGYSALGLHFVPNNLIGALWVQFAKAIEGSKRYQQCGYCRTWFEAGGNRTARADKKFCSGTCKANAHLVKKDQARRMASRHVPVAEIARKLDTKTINVRGWLKAR